jgi:hypothetical protein
MALTTSERMMHLVEEDVLVAINCIDYLTSHLGVMDADGVTLDLWKVAKEMTMEYMSSRGRSSEVTVLRDILKDVAVRISVELSVKISMDLIHVLLFTNSVELTARVTNCSQMLLPDDARRYMDNFRFMPGGFVSEKFAVSYKSMERLMLQSIEHELTRDEIEEVYKLAVWQSRHFIYHLRPDVVSPHSLGSVFGQRVGLDPFILETMLTGIQHQEHDHIPRQVASPHQDPFPSQCPSHSEMSSDSDEEKEKQDMNEKETEKVDEDCKSDSCTTKAEAQQLMALFEDVRNEEGLSNLISMLQDKIHSAQSLDKLQSVELDIKTMVEKLTLRSNELRSNLRELNDAVLSSASSVVETSLKQAIEDTTRQIEFEGGCVMALGKLKEVLTVKQQSFSVCQFSASISHPSLVDLKQCLQSVLLSIQRQEMDVRMELIIRSLPWFCSDEVASLQAGLRMTERNLNSSNNIKWSDSIEEIRHQCCELVDRHRTRQNQC